MHVLRRLTPAMLVLVYFSVIIPWFKIFLVTPILVLRFVWAAMWITMSFPEWHREGKAFLSNSKSIGVLTQPQYYLLKLERGCSML